MLLVHSHQATPLLHIFATPYRTKLTDSCKLLTEVSKIWHLGLPSWCMLWAFVLTLCTLAGTHIYRRFDGTCYVKLQFHPEEGGGPHSRSDHSDG